MTEDMNNELGTKDIVWNLNDLYTSINDPQIQTDLNRCADQAKAIRSQYAGKLATLVPEDFFQLLKSLEDLAVLKGRLGTFAFLQFTTQTQNAKAAGFMQKIREELSQISRETVFFELEWGQLDADKAEILAGSPKVADYRHYLQNIRKYAPHLLSEQEETLLLEISPVGRGAWTILFEKVMGQLKFGQKKRTEEEVLSDLYNPDRDVRKQAASDLTDGLKSQLHVLTHISNTLLADKMIEDRLRRYPSWIRSMNLYNELEDETVSTLVQSVTDRYDIPQRYYRLKKSLLQVDELFDYDRYAPLPNLPETNIQWTESKKMVLDAFYGFSEDMGTIAQKFFEQNWIHAPIMEGKRGGAFAHPCTPDVHPYVMVNFTGNIRDVSTVAHELGHGVHQFLAADRGYFNSDTPLVLAETASVFAELIVFNSQLELLEDQEQRKAFICQKLESIFATVFRQVAMNRFEDLAHQNRRDKGELDADQLSTYWTQTQQAMFKDSVTLTDNYAIWWSYIPHFLNSPGYVYSYAFGELLVLSLYNLYQQDKKQFVPKYLELLKAGGSKTPYELVAPFGIDLNEARFWQGGLEVIDTLLNKVE